MQAITKQELINTLKQLAEQGFISNGRTGNHGGIGNTLEDYLGIEENNLPIPNSGEWELKTKRLKGNSLTTLFHSEPSPQAFRFVPQIFLPLYGWRHKEGGSKYPEGELSFRQTIHVKPSDRGFSVVIDRNARKVLVSFDANFVQTRHTAWLEQVQNRVGLGQLDPQPYWGFDNLESIIGTKLLNCFFVQAQVKRIEGVEYFWYKKVQMLENFRFEGFITGLEQGTILVDFDARTGHNHGTKFRLRQGIWPSLYEKVTTIIDME